VTVKRVLTRCAETGFMCAFAPIAVNTTTEATTHRKCRSSLGSREDEGMARRLVLLLVAGALHSGNVLAQQLVTVLTVDQLSRHC